MSDWQQRTGFDSAQAEHDNADGVEQEGPQAFDYDLQEFIHAKAGDDALAEFFDLLTAFEKRIRLEVAESFITVPNPNALNDWDGEKWVWGHRKNIQAVALGPFHKPEGR